MRPLKIFIPAIVLFASCASNPEHRSEPAYFDVAKPPTPLAKTRDAQGLTPQLASYIEFALRNKPELGAAWARWSAAHSRTNVVDRLPEPMVMVSMVAHSDAMDPQLKGIGVQQAIPWLGQLSDQSEAATHDARAQDYAAQAQALVIAQNVAQAYWQLWYVRRAIALRTEHVTVMESMAEVTRGRIATGAASIADQLQIDLTVARLRDAVDSLRQDEAAAVAALRSSLGATGNTDFPTTSDAPMPRLPSETRDALVDAVERHPTLAVYSERATARELSAAAESAKGNPDFLIEAEWMKQQNVVTLGAGISLPVWRDSYGDAADSMHAEALAQRYEALAWRDESIRALDTGLSRVRDSVRRFEVLKETLIPQAESAYASLVGAYASGRANVAEILLVQRDLLDMRLELEKARMTYAVAWAELEKTVGRVVEVEGGAR